MPPEPSGDPGRGQGGRDRPASADGQPDVSTRRPTTPAQPASNQLDYDALLAPRSCGQPEQPATLAELDSRAAAPEAGGPSSNCLDLERVTIPQPQDDAEQQAPVAAWEHLIAGPLGTGGDFGGGRLDLVQHLALDGIFLGKQDRVEVEFGDPQAVQQQQQRQQQRQQQQHADAQQQADAPAAAAASSRRGASSGLPHRQPRQQQQQQPDRGTGQGPRPQQQQQQQHSQPRPHPFYAKPRHVKRHFMVPTSDGWKLHLIRTQVLGVPAIRHHPVLLVPGLGSSGAYSFDLSPAVSLADYLASKGFDVWTCELRGNGMSDKPGLFNGRSRWWTVDDYVERDMPALIRFVLKETHAPQLHCLGHSLGGMILCGVVARVDATTAKIRSLTAVGSGLFLEESWWRLFDRWRFLLHAMWVVPSGSLLRTYARLMFGPYAIPYLDMLYFWPSNVNPRVGRAMMRRNFSNISVGVIRQIASAFGPRGLLSADGKMVYADPARLAKVTLPSLFLVGDRDRMCPPEGCRRTWQMLGGRDKRFVCFGPASGFGDHYGHFDLLMGKRVEAEVFPLLLAFLEQHDAPKSRL